MKKKIQVFLLSCIVILVVIGCTKNRKHYHYFDGTFTAWTLFQQGSYWVYLNDVSHHRDSTYVDIQPRISNNGPGSAGNDYYEQFYYTVKNGFYTSVYAYRAESDNYCKFGFIANNEQY